jgi:hypothetical protein
VRTQPRHHENTGADDRADPQGCQLEDSEGALQTMFACLAGFLQEEFQWLPSQQVWHLSWSTPGYLEISEFYRNIAPYR